MRFILFFFGLLPLVLFSNTVKAEGWNCSVVTASTNVSPPNVTIPRDLPVGSLIGRQITTGTISAFTCFDDNNVLTMSQFGVKSSGTYVMTIEGKRVYSTNIPGVGYAIGGAASNNCSASGWVNESNNLLGVTDSLLLCSQSSIFNTLPIQGQLWLSYYKTAPTTGSGTVNAQTLGGFTMTNNYIPGYPGDALLTAAAFNVITTSCTVTSTLLSVNMGDVHKTAFNGIGTSPDSSNTKNVDIPLICDADIRVNVQIDGNVQNAAEGILNLSSTSGAASGVGIQLLYNSAPLTLAAPISVGTSGSGGAFNIPLQARYYQTQSAITPGIANSTATFTLTYQ